MSTAAGPSTRTQPGIPELTSLGRQLEMLRLDRGLTKQALANTICLALEIHAQLEEEIFYPAMRELAPEGILVGKSVPEHDEIRQPDSAREATAGWVNTTIEVVPGADHFFHWLVDGDEYSTTMGTRIWPPNM